MNTGRMNCLISLSIIALATLLTTSLPAEVIVDDSWADGGRNDGADPQDTNWWLSNSTDAIEVSTGSLGLVTGSSGRGIRATFAPQTLGIGDTITATYTFTTPATIGSNGGAFRIGLYDKLGRAELEDDLSASSGSPNALYDGLPGYMADYDIDTGSEDINIREHNLAATTGRLLGTTSGYDSIGNGGEPYTILANTTYVGTISVTRTGADSVDITSSLSQGGTLLSTHTERDVSGIANNFGMLAFQANASTFGASNTPAETDNGIDFTNVKIEVKLAPVAEP
jgi:hypothetical protein